MNQPMIGPSRVSPIGLGLWPIAGMTTLGTSESDSLATIQAALDAGINHLDTAWCYGVDGISERLLGRAVRGCREGLVIATKCGIQWAADGTRINNATPERLRWECEDSLRRMNLDVIDLLYLHSADGRTPIEQCAAALADLQQQGKCRMAGVSNLSLADLQAFHAVCPVAAVQYRYNLLQREIETAILPWCRERRIAVVVYWPLMKGLLAGRMRRDWQFDPADSRLKYPVFQPPEWEWNQQLLDRLDPIASRAGATIAQLVLGWTIRREGITVALCGAKRPWQIGESAAAMNCRFPEGIWDEVEAAVEARRQCRAATG